VLRGAAGRYGPTLDNTLRSAVVPYGYTVTIWASGAYLISLRGIPNGWQAFAFVTGAMLAFGALAWLSQKLPGRKASALSPLHPDSSHPILASGVHIAAVGIAFGVATLVDRALEDYAWFVGSFAITFIYLLVASGELALAVEISERRVGLQRARLLRRR
jgi:hypothetical protein